MAAAASTGSARRRPTALWVLAVLAAVVVAAASASIAEASSLAAGFAALPSSRRRVGAGSASAVAVVVFRPPPTELRMSAPPLADGGKNDGGGGISLSASKENELIQEDGGEEELSEKLEQDEVDGLTAQERVLRSLGVDPESPAERDARIASRLAEEESLRRKKRMNVAVAVLAFAAAVLNYAFRLSHPVTEIELLAEMQSKSDPLTVIGRNGRPTVVDFWAPWCENCRASAPTLMSVEKEYADRVNFVMVNGDDPDAWPALERFGVDAIPHLALVGGDGYVETALIGPIPRSVLRADLDTMLEEDDDGVSCATATATVAMPSAEGEDGAANESTGKDNERCGEGERRPLPYVMYDAFRGRPDKQTVMF